MEARKTVMLSTVCLLTLVAADAARASPSPRSTASGCAVAAPAARPEAGRRQGVAVARSGEIPGLGTVHGTIAWNNRKTIALVGNQFEVARSFDPLTREIDVTVAGAVDDAVTVRIRPGGALTVLKGSRPVDTANAAAIWEALHTPAVAAFRERMGAFERKLIGGQRQARADDPHADGFLLTAALLSSLAGDPSAMGRARDLIMRRIHGKVQAARFDFKDCVTDYERYLLDIDTQRTQCLDAANDRDSWYARAADRLGCEVEFMAGALAGEGQFISCTALGSMI